jgi:hypothetical protein
MSKSFAQLGVPSFICDALARRGITEPFEIQAATIADMLAGRDVCGRAPTGSGKTLAFGVPVVTNTGQAAAHRSPSRSPPSCARSPAACGSTPSTAGSATATSSRRCDAASTCSSPAPAGWKI